MLGKRQKFVREITDYFGSWNWDNIQWQYRDICCCGVGFNSMRHYHGQYNYKTMCYYIGFRFRNVYKSGGSMIDCGFSFADDTTIIDIEKEVKHRIDLILSQLESGNGWHSDRLILNTNEWFFVKERGLID
jgi:hypothetical protein